jgi:hypothetical protein
LALLVIRKTFNQQRSWLSQAQKTSMATLRSRTSPPFIFAAISATPELAERPEYFCMTLHRYKGFIPSKKAALLWAAFAF